MTRALRSHWTAAAALSLLFAALHTWPLASAPGRLSLHYNGDVMLNEWIVAWVQHQLPRAPLDLFAGNIFYPAPDVLAFSEPLILPALLGYPIRLAGGSPVLVHNVLLLLGLALTTLAGYALVYRWTSDPAAALLAGSALTFNTQLLARIEHLQAMHGYALPLALLAADRAIVAGRWRDAFGVAAALTAAAYTSGYLTVFTFMAVALMFLTRVPEWRGKAAAIVPRLATAGVCAALAILPIYIPYRRAAVQQQMTRSVEGVYQFSATWDGFLASYGRLHDWLWNAGAQREFPESLFPGIVVALLAVVGLLSVLRSRTTDAQGRGRVTALLVIGALGAILAVGTRTPVYGWLYAIFPPMSSLRAAGRFGGLFLLAMAVLAGLGLAAMRRRWGSSPGVSVAAAICIALVHAEAFRAPYPLLPYNGIAGPYVVLADSPDPVVLVEAPFYPGEVIFQNAEYVFNSTAHWRPLLNGYSGFTPRSYREYAKVFWEFPDPAAVDAMRAAGATHLMVHPRRFGSSAEATMKAALANPHLERVASGRDGVTLFRLRD